MKRPKRVTVTAIVVILMLALFLCPYTGWLIRYQVPIRFSLPLPAGCWLRTHRLPNPLPPVVSVSGRQHLEGAGEPFWLRVVRFDAAEYPHNYHAQLALAFASGPDALRVMESLQGKFGDQPSLYAHLIRLACLTYTNVRRSDNYAMEGLHPEAPIILSDIERLALAKMAVWAKQGERLDPRNAFFPFMRASVLYSLSCDTEANNEVVISRTADRWYNYIPEETQCADETALREIGRRPWLLTLMNHSDVAMSNLSIERDTARFISFKAATAERVGRPQDGLALRAGLLRCGGLMRADGATLYSGGNGALLVRIALRNLYGRPQIPRSSLPNQGENLTQEQWDAMLLNPFQSYATSLHRCDVYRLAAGQLTAARRSNTIERQVNDYVTMGMPQRELCRLAELWFLAAALISNVTFLLALVLLGHILRRSRGQRRASLLVGWALFAVFLAWACVNRWLQLGGVDMRGSFDLVPSLFGDGPAGKLCDFMFSNPSALYLLGGLASAIVPSAIAVRRIAGAIRCYRGEKASAVPRRVRTLPILWLFVLAYSISIIALARAEDHASQRLQARTTNCYHYDARLVGMTWPEFPK